MRPFIAICLFAVIGLHFTARISGYVNCMVRAYVIDQRNLSEDCGCIHYVALAFGDVSSSEKQLQQVPQTLKLADYVPAFTLEVPVALAFPAVPVYGTTTPFYHYSPEHSIFHPPCKASLLFM